MFFEIEGTPVPQGRARATAINGRARVYDPPKSRNYKEAVKLAARSYMARTSLEPHSGPVMVHIDLIFTVPKSYTRKRLEAIQKGEELYTKKPDVDNVAKAITDALNKICYKDDSQIVQLTVKKYYGTQAKAVVEIIPVEGTPEDWRE